MQFWKRKRSIPGVIETLTREEQARLAQGMWYDMRNIIFEPCTAKNLEALIEKAQRALDLLDAP